MPVLVIKVGSAVITINGVINEAIIQKLAAEIAQLSTVYNVVLVSSGAVASGKTFIKNYRGTLAEKKVAAAVGNPMLIQLYHKHFTKHKLTVAQALCERHHFSNRRQFLQLKETFQGFWSNHMIPVVNENDLVSNVELKFSDNDELATLIAIGFNAETLLLCTSAGGFMDDQQNIIPLVETIDDTVMRFVTKDKSAVGLGGMISKLTFTKLATSLGIRVIITGLSTGSKLQKAIDGTEGSTFTPKKANLKARQKWLASGSITLGSLHIDKGAERAVKKRKSLLAIGIAKVTGIFEAGEVVQLINDDEQILGVAKSRLNATDIAAAITEKNILAAHADDIVIF